MIRELEMRSCYQKHIPSPTLEDLDACPNLKQIYISSSTELTFQKFAVPVLNYKDISQYRFSTNTSNPASETLQ